MINYKKGDAIKGIFDDDAEHKFLLHVVNNCGVMGAGIAAQIKTTWPEVDAAYYYLCQAHRDEKNILLGLMQPVDATTKYRNGSKGKIEIINLFAQDHFPTASKPIALNYDALESSLFETMQYIHYGFRNRIGRTTVHMPRIGCGLAGGAWNKVLPLIERELDVKSLDITVWEL